MTYLCTFNHDACIYFTLLITAAVVTVVQVNKAYGTYILACINHLWKDTQKVGYCDFFWIEEQFFREKDFFYLYILEQ